MARRPSQATPHVWRLTDGPLTLTRKLRRACRAGLPEKTLDVGDTSASALAMVTMSEFFSVEGQVLFTTGVYMVMYAIIYKMEQLVVVCDWSLMFML